MDVIERLVADLPVKKHSVFQNTKPEILFGIMFPWLQYQVTFGTGKEGLAKWGSKKYVADFYDPNKKEIFEIDGSSHNTPYRKVSDALRDSFSESKGIKTYRISNQTVEKEYVRLVKEGMEANGEQYQGAFGEFFGC